MKNNFKKTYTTILIIILSLTFGYGACYLINKDKIERNTYDVNNDGKVSAVDYVLIKNYIMNQN